MNAPRHAQIKVLPSEDGQFYFTVVAANGETLVTSETYRERETAIKSARALGRAVLSAAAASPSAIIVEGSPPPAPAPSGPYDEPPVE